MDRFRLADIILTGEKRQPLRKVDIYAHYIRIQFVAKEMAGKGELLWQKNIPSRPRIIR